MSTPSVPTLVPVYLHGCYICASSFKDNDDLIKHVKKEHPRTCFYCAYTLDNIFLLREHVTERHPNICLLCDHVSPTEAAKDSHLASMHRVQMNDNAAPSPVSNNDDDDNPISDEDILKLVATVNDLINQRAKRRREWAEVSSEYKKKLRKADEHLEKTAIKAVAAIL